MKQIKESLIVTEHGQFADEQSKQQRQEAVKNILNSQSFVVFTVVGNDIKSFSCFESSDILHLGVAMFEFLESIRVKKVESSVKAVGNDKL